MPTNSDPERAADNSPSPAFQFYPKEWLSSATVNLMTPAQEGGYFRLLCYAWLDKDCSLPDDDVQLATLSRLGEGWLANGSNQMSTVVRKCFVPHPKLAGRLVNVRLLKEREKQRLWREKSAKGGIKSGKTRSSKKEGWLANGSSLVRTKREPKVNSPVSSFQSPVCLSTPKAPRGGKVDVVESSEERPLASLPEIEAEKARIGKWFNRTPGARWTGEEERMLVGVMREPGYRDEASIIEAWLTGGRAYKPAETVTRLLRDWTGQLDRARASGRKPPELTDAQKYLGHPGPSWDPMKL